MAVEADEARFWSKVALPNEQGCMLWLASCKSSGYPQFRLAGTMRYAHRAAYALAYGPIPDGLHVDHLCRVRHCVAPLRLEAVTQAENNRRADVGANMRAKTHCPRGHPYAGENLAIYAGRRNCRACIRAGRAKGKVTA